MAGYSTVLTPEAFALLETIAGPESAGNYGVQYGGGLFSDFSDHPRDPVLITSGPNKGRYSTAAGKYQFLGSTWDDVSEITGVKDFSPRSQDINAWVLAQQEYKRDTGRNLQSDLAAGDLSRVAPSLRNQWTSMPGGIEQGITGNAFGNAYWNNMGLNLNVKPDLGALGDATRGTASRRGVLSDPAPRALSSAGRPGSGAMGDIGIMPQMFELGQGNEWWKEAGKGSRKSILPAIPSPANGPVPVNPKPPSNMLTGLLDNVMGGVNSAVRRVQSKINPVQMMMGSLPLRTAVIDPAIRNIFNGAPRANVGSGGYNPNTGSFGLNLDTHFNGFSGSGSSGGAHGGKSDGGGGNFDKLGRPVR